jgi:hypothetical protein
LCIASWNPNAPSKRYRSPDSRRELATSRKDDQKKMKFNIAKQVALKVPTNGKPKMKDRVLSAFTEDEYHLVSADYYHATHFFGEDLYDEDNNYIDRDILAPKELRDIQEHILTGEYSFELIHIAELTRVEDVDVSF